MSSTVKMKTLATIPSGFSQYDTLQQKHKKKFKKISFYLFILVTPWPYSLPLCLSMTSSTLNFLSFFFSCSILSLLQTGCQL